MNRSPHIMPGLRHGNTPPGRRGNPRADSVVRRSCKLIDRRFTRKLRVGEIAREVGVSQSHISHLFPLHTGLSFTDYLARRRVLEMKRLLTNSDLGITKSLFAAGFQSVSQGNRVFLAATGMSPRQFRTAAQR